MKTRCRPKCGFVLCSCSRYLYGYSRVVRVFLGSRGPLLHSFFIDLPSCSSVVRSLSGSRLDTALSTYSYLGLQCEARYLIVWGPINYATQSCSSCLGKKQSVGCRIAGGVTAALQHSPASTSELSLARENVPLSLTVSSPSTKAPSRCACGQGTHFRVSAC